MYVKPSKPEWSSSEISYVLYYYLSYQIGRICNNDNYESNYINDDDNDDDENMNNNDNNNNYK